MIVLRESKFKKISVEIFCLVILAAALIPTNFYIEPHNRGFFCNDQTIMYPRVLKETVSNLTLGIIALIFLILIIIGEIFHARKTRSSQQLLTFKVPNWITLIYHKAGTYLIGGITTVLIGDVIKLTVGRLRPHFLDVCAPNIDCTLATNLNRYVGPGEFVCTSNFTDDLRNARLSFPSSHSSTLTYVGVYFIVNKISILNDYNYDYQTIITIIILVLLTIENNIQKFKNAKIFSPIHCCVGNLVYFNDENLGLFSPLE
ncbi:hypothetical protein G9C98_001290 [Cotesia typhae]|uniref:Phosphatidic acid phosphatase type 2/haloperoxidase domain-containing protein n=1 Tax=Cotesia typhae TaxID=2053667 RepID=A0A8J5QKZ5_9HYME|nr:hypothetical protein G9C98_001290 [Cotesia typhae]